jgi:hypothetical protein
MRQGVDDGGAKVGGDPCVLGMRAMKRGEAPPQHIGGGKRLSAVGPAMGRRQIKG